MNATCPYCQNTLKKEPQRTTKCSNCKNYIYPRLKSVFYSKPLLTEEENLISTTFDSLTTTVGYGVNAQTYIDTRNKLTEQFGVQASWGDVTWSIYNQLALKFAKAGDYEHVAWVYGGMSSFLWQSHKPFRDCMMESIRHTLMHYQSLGAISARVTNYAFECKACEGLAGQTYIIAEAIENVPLPPLDCTCVLDKKLAKGFCACSLAANFDENYVIPISN